MATWDSNDLLSRCKLLAARPATDSSITDVQWFQHLTDAQSHWTNTFATLVPWVLIGPPTLLVSTDNGLTYPFPGCVSPLAVEIYDALNTARLMKPCTFWDPNGDYVFENDHIRFSQGQSQTFANGPYARFINPPDVLDATHAPTLVPAHCRLLLVYRAVAEWANRGGFRDPKPFYEMEQRFWMGNPNNGDTGVLGALRSQNPFYGATAFAESLGGPLEGVSTGQGYRVLRLGQG